MRRRSIAITATASWPTMFSFATCLSCAPSTENSGKPARKLTVPHRWHSAGLIDKLAVRRGDRHTKIPTILELLDHQSAIRQLGTNGIYLEVGAKGLGEFTCWTAGVRCPK